jgi:hypothetical protein
MPLFNPFSYASKWMPAFLTETKGGNQMVSLRRIAVIVLSIICMAIGAVGFAAERSSQSVPMQRSAPTFTPSVATPKINVTSPMTGGSWPAGSSQTVAWSCSGDIGPSVSILMLKGSATVYNLTGSVAVGVAGKGTFTWTVPQDAVAGTGYSIVVVSNANRSLKGVSGLFSLTAGMARVLTPGAVVVKKFAKTDAKSVVSPQQIPNISAVGEPGIEILTPHSGDKWPSGEMHELKWKVTGIPADPKTMVRIRMTSWDWPDIYDKTADVPMTGPYPLKLTTPPGQNGAEYIITASIVDPATNKKHESTIDGIVIGQPFIEIVNLVALTAAPWVPGKTYKIVWKVRGSGYAGDLTFAMTDPVSNNVYLSSTSIVGNAGTYEWTAKAFAKKMKFSITPQLPKVLGTSFVFEVDTGKYPTLSAALTAPAAPSLSAGLIDYKQHVSLKWQDNSGNEKEFVVERKHLAGGKGAYGEIGRAPANATSFQDKAIPVAGSYWYRVSAVNDNGAAASNEVNITTLAPAPPVDLVPVNPRPAKGPAGFCPELGFAGDIDITIRNLGPVASSTTNAVLFVSNKQTNGYYEELKTAIPALQKGASFVWHAHAAKCLEGAGPDCLFNLMINYNPTEVLESDMSTNDIYFTCRGPLKLQKNLAPGTQVK